MEDNLELSKKIIQAFYSEMAEYAVGKESQRISKAVDDKKFSNLKRNEHLHFLLTV